MELPMRPRKLHPIEREIRAKCTNPPWPTADQLWKALYNASFTGPPLAPPRTMSFEISHADVEAALEKLTERATRREQGE